MPNPFTIHVFSTNGDPEGIRIISKTNWSGVAVAFPRELVNEVVKEEYAQQPGTYILAGNLAEETIYIGEADPVGVRLKQHLQKDWWTWGVFFVDTHGLGKTEVQFLESELVRIAHSTGNAILMNRNVPNAPHMTRQSKAAAEVFLNEILLILPMIGLRAFSKPKIQPTEDQQEEEPVSSDRDTIVVPAKEEGFNSVFIGKDSWWAVRISQQHIPKIKYIAAYQVAPISAITHIAEIHEIVPYQDSGKYLVNFKGKAKKLDNVVRLKEGKVGSQPQSARYTSYDKLMSAKYVHELW
jgi:hypothetical protein